MESSRLATMSASLKLPVCRRVVCGPPAKEEGMVRNGR